MERFLVITSQPWTPTNGTIVQQAPCTMNLTYQGNSIQAHFYEAETDSGGVDLWTGDPIVVNVLPLTGTGVTNNAGVFGGNKAQQAGRL